MRQYIFLPFATMFFIWLTAAPVQSQTRNISAVAGPLPQIIVEHIAVQSVTTLWARTQVDALRRQGGDGATMSPLLEQDITRLGLAYRLPPPFASFVAVEENRSSAGGAPRLVAVPITPPEGSSAYYGWAGVGDNDRALAFCNSEMIKNIGPLAIMVILTLLTMGMLLTATAVERGLKLAVVSYQLRRMTRPVMSAFRAGRVDEAFELSARHRESPLAAVMQAGLRWVHLAAQGPACNFIGRELTQLARQRIVTNKRAELQRGLQGLATIGSTAPFVGLFGTVFGIISAFTGMKNAESAGIGAVAGGIAEALLTTALGLAVAVPAVWVFNYFTGKVDRLLGELDNSAAETIDRLQRHVAAEQSRAPLRHD